jgi:hypothetical protein
MAWLKSEELVSNCFAAIQHKTVKLSVVQTVLCSRYCHNLTAIRQEIVNASMLTELEKEWMKEYPSESFTNLNYFAGDRVVERIVMPNLFDMHRNYHN